MLSELSGITTSLVSAALDATMLRHQVIATNIANAGNPDYMTKRVTFEEQLAFAQDGLRNVSDADAERAVSEVKPQIVETGRLSKNAGLDVEVGKLAENVVRYEALLKGLSKHMAIIEMAISEGKK